MATEHTKHRPRANKIVYEMLKDHNQKYSRPGSTTMNDVFTDRSAVRLYKVTKLCDMIESIFVHFDDKRTTSNPTIVAALTRTLLTEKVLVPQDSGHWSIKKDKLNVFEKEHMHLGVPDRMLSNIFDQNRFPARALTDIAASAVPAAEAASTAVKGVARQCTHSRVCFEIWGAWGDGAAQGKHAAKESERKKSGQSGCTIC